MKKLLLILFLCLPIKAQTLEGLQLRLRLAKEHVQRLELQRDKETDTAKKWEIGIEIAETKQRIKRIEKLIAEKVKEESI